MSAMGFPEQVGKYNAGAQMAQGSQTQQATYANTAQMGNQILQLEGAQKSAYGAGGIDVNTGTPLSVMRSTAAQGELAKRLQIFQANQKAQNKAEQANLDVAQGKAEAQSNWMNLGSTVLTSAMQAGSLLSSFGGAGAAAGGAAGGAGSAAGGASGLLALLAAL